LLLDPAYLAFAAEAALAAGRIHRQYFRRQPAIRKKGPIDLVTEADLAAERDFRDRVARAFPGHVVLGEEATPTPPARPRTDSATQPFSHSAIQPSSHSAIDSTGDRAPSRCRWIIDPLDGTTNFAHGLAFFCVSIGLEVDGRIELGVVYDPVAQELFTAERDGGARLNGEPIAVSPCTDIIDGLLCTGFPYSIRERRRRQVEVFAAFLGRARAVRRLGSAALDLCYVAAGRLDGFWEEQLHAWDMAAGALIVREAGGRVTSYDDGPLDLFGGGQIVASNGALHGAMLDVIGEARG
jgi:myo-inositol-1(or 4)-monophosphatase